jgi:hypothetical protein
MGEVCGALMGARKIDLAAYTVWGPALRAVKAAARHGARVTVHLEARHSTIRIWPMRTGTSPPSFARPARR